MTPGEPGAQGQPQYAAALAPASTNASANASAANSGALVSPGAGAAAATAAPAAAGGGAGLVQSGSATSNSLGVLGRTAFCPNLGWIYNSDPFSCNPVG